MANSVATVTVLDQWVDYNKYYHVRGTVAITASAAVYVAGGIAMSLAGSDIKASRTPVRVTVWGIGGYIYQYVKGADAASGLLRIFAQTNAAAEDDPLGQLAAAAMPAGVSGDTVEFEAVFLGTN